MNQPMIRKYILIFSLFLMQQCLAQDLYHQEIDQWKKERLLELKSDQGWLNLAGLFWIKEGNNILAALLQMIFGFRFLPSLHGLDILKELETS
jgi:uncharacterized protein (DUF1684 family)